MENDTSKSTKWCPSCGRRLPGAAPIIENIATAERLVEVLSSIKDRHVYAAASGGYYIEYGGGRVARPVIDDALARDLIVKQWPDTDYEYWRAA